VAFEPSDWGGIITRNQCEFIRSKRDQIDLVLFFIGLPVGQAILKIQYFTQALNNLLEGSI
jgi:hypothetical protein